MYFATLTVTDQTEHNLGTALDQHITIELPGSGLCHLTSGIRALCPVSRPPNPGIMLDDDGVGMHALYMQ